MAHTLINATRHAFVHGWSTSMWIGDAGMALLLLFLVVRAPTTTAQPDKAQPTV